MSRLSPAELEQRRRERGAEAERVVVEALRASLPDGSLVLAGVPLLIDGLEREVDALALVPGHGVAVVEVKSGRMQLVDGEWRQGEGKGRATDPVFQARRAMHAVVDFLREMAPEAASVRIAHLVAFPGSPVRQDLRTPGLTRRMVIDSADLLQQSAAMRVTSALARDGSGQLVPDADLVARLAEVFGPTVPGLSESLAAAEEHDVVIEQLTRDQDHVLDLTQHLTRVHIVGGAGTGKTWLALERARRLGAEGKRVALLCYSRGLARYLTRMTATWPRNRPAWVGLFHDLPVAWGAEPGRDDLAEDWEERLPDDLARLAPLRPESERFDAIVVDEAQDFGDRWWPALLQCLRDPENGGLTIFSDDAQRVFPRQGHVPIGEPLTLVDNLRSTRQIAQTFASLGSAKMRPRGGNGLPVRLVEVPFERVLDAADDAVEAVLEEGWDPGHVALLCTGSRHPEQVSAVGIAGYDGYWDACLDGDDVFYGHVLNFKGLERRVVVLAVNGVRDAARARHLLYTGMSRARSLLVVVGPRVFLEQVGGEGVVRRLASATDWEPAAPTRS